MHISIHNKRSSSFYIVCKSQLIGLQIYKDGADSIVLPSARSIKLQCAATGSLRSPGEEARLLHQSRWIVLQISFLLHLGLITDLKCPPLESLSIPLVLHELSEFANIIQKVNLTYLNNLKLFINFANCNMFE